MSEIFDLASQPRIYYDVDKIEVDGKENNLVVIPGIVTPEKAKLLWYFHLDQIRKIIYKVYSTNIIIQS